MKTAIIFFTICFGIANAINCKPVVNGVQYDLTPLIASNGSYTWQDTVNNTKVWFQLQICDDVTPQIPSCHASPINQLSFDKKTCLSLGNSNVAAWDTTPSGDGLRLLYFKGDPINNIEYYNSVIYLICTPNEIGQPSFEHVRICTDPANGLQLGGQYHFFFGTKYACPPGKRV